MAIYTQEVLIKNTVIRTCTLLYNCNCTVYSTVQYSTDSVYYTLNNVVQVLLAVPANK